MKRRMNKLLGLAALCGALAVPAMAQLTPAQTNLDASAGQTEERNARGNQLTDVSPEEARANQLKRCDNLPEFFKQDCISRVESGEGNIDQVIGGGDFRESVTTMPQSELERERANIGAIQLPSTPSEPSLSTD